MKAKYEVRIAVFLQLEATDSDAAQKAAEDMLAGQLEGMGENYPELEGYSTDDISVLPLEEES